jgi:diguanylate cyclase (GGDEF)-like protein
VNERVCLHLPPATTLDLDRRQLTRGGRTTRLTALEARLLRYLWERPGQVVSTEELSTAVWGYAPGTVNRAVDSAVRRLRHKLEPEPASPRHLVGFGGQGYSLDGVSEIPGRPGQDDVPRPYAEILAPSTLSDDRDPLTGLLCRSALVHRLEGWLEQGAGDSLCVLVCALDRLRHINASMGLSAGDALLARAGHRLQASAAPHTVGRFAGNAFVVVARETRDDSAALQLSELLLQELEAPFELDGRWCHVGLNIGVARGGKQDSAEALIRHATLALEEAEKTGPGRVVLFDKGLAERTEDDADIEAALAQAIEDDELALHYQPIFELGSGRIRALEALLRWRRPGFGLVPTDRFIRVAEQSSLITRLQQWVVPRALAELGRIVPGDPSAGPDIWINISGYTLSRPDIASSTSKWLEEAGVPAQRVTFELTETGLLRDEAAARKTLTALREVGVHLAIDDFGTGYASLSHLVRFPVSVLKIDKSFVDPLGEIDESMSIAATIIEVGRHFGLEVVAEGVERPSQLAALRRLGCALVQGHLLCPPAPLEDLADIAERCLDSALLPTH